MTKTLFGLLALGGVVQSDAAIIFRDHVDIPLFSQLGGERGLDLNIDGVDDLNFQFSQRQFDIIGNGTNRVIATPVSPPDLGAFVDPLPAGQELEGNVGRGLFWYAPALNSVGATFFGCANIGCIGPWGGNTAFVGVEFDISGGTHYGWVEIETPFPGIPGGNILRLAYEDEPGKSILTGAIPEPSLHGLFALASSAFLLRRRRHVTPSTAKTSKPAPII